MNKIAIACVTLLTLLLLLVLFALFSVFINQKTIVKNQQEINSKLDFQTATIQKTIDDRFNQGFDCYNIYDN